MNWLLGILGFDPAPIQTIESVRFGLGWGWAGLLLALLVALPWFILTYRVEDKPCPRPLFITLTGLRILFVAGLLTMLAGLKCTVSGWIPQKNKLALVLDTSRSMSIKEEERSRIERLQAALQKGRLLEKLEKKTGITPALFSFAGSVAPLGRDDVASFGLSADGPQTNLTRAVTDITGHLGEGNLLGVVILTDGAHNTGDSPLDALGRVRTPLYFLGAGKTGQTRDLAVSIERPPAIGYLNSMVRLRGELRIQRIASASIPVTVLRDGAPFTSLSLEIPAGQTRIPFAINIPCDTEGAFTYSVSVPKLDGELTHENNETAFLLKVVKERLKILILAGSPSWDQTFIRAAARGDPNAHVCGWTRITDDRWLPTVDFELKAAVPTPAIAPDLEDADVVILAGIRETVLEPHAELLLKKLESGRTGMLILPGADGYAKLGYAGSKLAQMFPVPLDGESWVGTPCSLALPTRETPYAFLRLLDDPVENQEFFSSLPKFDGLFTYPGRKSGAEVLLSTTLSRGGTLQPAFLTHRVGQGNVAMLCGGPLWPMGFTQVPTDRTIRPYTAFVINTLKWLANRREDAQVTLELPSSRGFVGQPATLRVWVSDARRQPVDSAQVTAQLKAGSGEPMSLTFTATTEKGCYEASFIPAARGLHAITAKAVKQGSLLGEASGKLLVEVPTVEFDDPEVNIALMTALASSSGGAYRPIEAHDELLDLIKPTPGQKRETKTFDARDSGILLVLLLILPLIEWTIRRKRGFS